MSGGTEGWMDGWGMNVTVKERLYKHTHKHLDMIELHAYFLFFFLFFFLFKWQAKYDHTPLISFHSSFLF